MMQSVLAGLLGDGQARSPMVMLMTLVAGNDLVGNDFAIIIEARSGTYGSKALRLDLERGRCSG